MPLDPNQINVLLAPIKPSRVAQAEGYSHVEGYDIRAMLIRIFGFGGWSDEGLDTSLMYEEETTTKAGKPAFKVAYRSTRRLTVNDLEGNVLGFYDGTAVGESIMPAFKRGDAHDMAAKTAETQALKRCAANLGDQFGLSLYRNGSIAPLVRKLSSGEAFEPPTPTPTPEGDTDGN